MSREWELLFPTVHIQKRPREFFDHNLLFVFTQQSQQYKFNRDFRFELTWLAQSDFLPRVKEMWLAPTRDSRTLDRVLFKLKKV
jgi:hypothetical protein